VTAPLAPLELALGLVLGGDRPAVLPGDGPADPLAALHAAVRPALRRAPCLVSFSGGRDSSAVLAVAAAVARREGLPDPIPVTIRAAGAPAAEESRWQELVVAHLGLHDWLRLEFAGELDVVGPIARRALRRHGLLWPFNAHFHVPMLEAARGGTLLTGIGGDELFGATTSRRAGAVIAGRVRPVPRDARRVTLHASPRPLRRWWHERALGDVHPWLTPAGARAARRALADRDAGEPRRMAARMAYVRAARYLRVGTQSLDALARDAGAALGHPLLDPAVWSAVARSAPRGGHLGRADAMESIFSTLVPRALLTRPDKACFDEVFFHDHSRAMAAGWTGEGVPSAYVNAAALREHWRAAAPRAQSFSLLQAAWLASSDRLEQPPGGFVERVPAARPAQPQHRQ
jgi:asparagine synthase (glutamine-hydrolysing)